MNPRPWIDTQEVLENLWGRRAYERFVDLGIDEGHRADLSGRPGQRRTRSGEWTGKPTPNLWFGGRVMGSREFATRSVIRSRRNGEELRPEKTARPKNLEEIAHEICVTAGICVEDLRGSGRSRPISRARMMLVRRALVEDGLRAVDVARYLRMSTAAVAAYRRKFTS